MTNASAAITIDWVTVGNPGNLAQSAGNRNHAFSGGDGYGAVGYEYQIGKYEVTNAQYAAFLNDAAKSDPYALYNTNMSSNVRGGITRSGSDGNYTYSVKEGMGNKPVVFVSWFDAARMANWMHNGQGSGSTETGAYPLNGATSDIVTVSVNASVWIPTEDEWFKAAYYNGTTEKYSLFATGGDTISTSEANYNNFSGTSFIDVGAYSYPSFYGTYDQSGNAWEWLGSVSGLRGGSWNSADLDLRSSARLDFASSTESSSLGFRFASTSEVSTSEVSAIPEPSTSIGLAGLLAGSLFLRQRRKRR